MEKQDLQAWESQWQKHESKKIVLNQAQKNRLKNSNYILEWLWSSGRYVSYSELTKNKLEDRISTRN